MIAILINYAFTKITFGSEPVGILDALSMIELEKSGME